MKNLDKDRIAKALGAERRGPVSATAGYFGALGLAADVGARLRTPAAGGRATDPAWTERRLLPLAPATLARLEELASQLRERTGADVQPLQLAAVLMEKLINSKLVDEEIASIAEGGKRRVG
jgi:hypothetical protein